jgi:hypothetical protein
MSWGWGVVRAATWAARAAPFAALAALAMAGCGGDDPPPRIGAHPGAGDSTAGSSSSNGGPTGGDAGPGAATDAAPSYRDPAAGDGACAVPNMLCGNACIAVGNDVGHCGSCDTKCVGDTAQCIGGRCACGPGFDYCALPSPGCLDIATDTSNCGACGNVCDPNQFDACVGGQCTTTQ